MRTLRPQKKRKSKKPVKAAKSKSGQLTMALRCAENGLSIVPLHSKKNGLCTCGVNKCEQAGQHPRTENGFEDATTDPAIVRSWWTKWPNAPIAVATGAQDVITVVVASDKAQPVLKGVREHQDTRSPAWLKMVEDNGLPPTVMFRRGDRSFLLFRASLGGVPDGKLELAEGVTIFGTGEHVRLPGSLNADERHPFERGFALGEVDIAPIPKWLAKMIWSGMDSERPSSPSFESFLVPFDSIMVGHVDYNREKVQMLAESIDVTGVRLPLVVRQVSERGFALLSDHHVLAAMKSRTMDAAPCIVMQVDETDGQLWQLGELLNQPDLSPLDWAEAIMKWVRLVRQKDAQIEHPVGGRQAHDKGLSRGARVLGVSRSDMQRAEKMASISAAAKAEIRRIKLTVQRDVLAIARLPDDEQFAAVHNMSGPKPRTVVVRGPAQPKDSESPAVSDHEPATPPAAEPAPAEDDGEDREDREGEVVESPSTAPDNADGLDIPPFLSRADGEKQYEAFKSRWVQFCEADFKALPAAMQARFATEVHEMSVLATGKGEGPR